ncbi:GNAT family N-acetyltransferase [Flagellimonas halotolerans]|uniref:GNAT family N-acetyltransferase n=1 Tax=Flagellimonas halotolerans TaxID=3112164 RepID=A0ABU6IQ31_9FLAO|nr:MULTISPECIES: GNAT family N-acetyltransferase [unclassified Allomuricauda]MEC3965366.1 GNAT family N-acetyltransferase [Muricauda sp. SYSU M86414]MEC4265232.1 GNAT family N-acetyltransferase [Muricauda sp. SYSU M84420]
MTLPKVNIRTATLDDLPVLLDFEQEIIKTERPFDDTIKEGPISYYDIGEMVQDPKSHVVVAEVGGKIVASGYAIPKKARHYLDHEFYAYLGFMYTDGDFRGQGINAMIVEELKKWSHNQGFKEIRLTVYNENQPAIKAYEKVGFKKHIIEMRLE